MNQVDRNTLTKVDDPRDSSCGTNRPQNKGDIFSTGARVRVDLHADLRLPPLSRTSVYVAELQGKASDEFNVLRLAEVIATDPVMVAAVLRNVNSAYYGLRRPVGTVHHAIRLLGLSEVSNLVLALQLVKLREIFRSAEQTEIYYHIIRHSLAAAAVANILLNRYASAVHPLSYTTALLLPIGRLVFMFNQPDVYEGMCVISDGNRLPTLAEEHEIFGSSSAQIGAFALGHWKFPDEVRIVVEYQSSLSALYSEPVSSLAKTVGLANSMSAAICKDLAKVVEGEINVLDDECVSVFADHVEVSPSDLVVYMCEQMDSVRSFVEMILGSNHGLE